MQTLKQVQRTVSPALLRWIMRAIAAMRPSQDTIAVAAVMARSGHLAGM